MHLVTISIAQELHSGALLFLDPKYIYMLGRGELCEDKTIFQAHQTYVCNEQLMLDEIEIEMAYILCVLLHTKCRSIHSVDEIFVNGA